MRKLISILIILFFQSINSFANGCVPEKKAEYQPIYGIAKFIRTQDKENLKYLIEAYNPNDQITGLKDENKIIEKLKNVDKASAHLKAMPEGKRALYIGGAIIYDLFSDGGRLTSQFDPIVLTTKDGSFIFPYKSPWMDTWKNIVTARMTAFSNALKAAGVEVDYIMLDFEEKTPASYELNAQDQYAWAAIMQDKRWPALREKLGMTDEQFLKGLNKNGDLVGSKTDIRPVAQKWNIVQEEERIRYFFEAIYKPFAKNYPRIRVGSFEDGVRSDSNPYGSNCFRFTNTWGYAGAILQFEGFEPSENLRFGGAINTPSGDIFLPKDSWGNLLTAVQIARSNAQNTTRRSLHWVTGPDYYEKSEINILPYYRELVFHIALNNADQIFFQTSRWSEKAGHEEVDSILKQLNDPELFAYSDRQLITRENIDYDSDYLASGVSIKGKRIYRISWKIGAPHNVPNFFSLSTGQKVTQKGECETGMWIIVE